MRQSRVLDGWPVVPEYAAGLSEELRDAKLLVASGLSAKEKAHNDERSTSNVAPIQLKMG